MKKLKSIFSIQYSILKIAISFALIGFTGIPSFCQTGQLPISRVEQMPDLPSPYLMRNWKDVAVKYDAFVFKTDAIGQYLPFISLKSNGINYPSLQPILLDTYVGTNSSNQAEAINIIPSIVGASLMNINKSNQSGINWVEKIKDFYNSSNGQNVYLNGYNSSSGNDWWYDLMPNVFFYQAYTLYPSTPDFETQFIQVADQWLKAVHDMGGKTTPWTVPQMNYRGWRLSSMTGNADGVKEPESAGTIGWLLYHAYIKTGEQKYLEGAQMAIEFLSGLTSNPSYELQLPYGTLTAAKLNATLGTNYNIDKMLNWSFDRGALRGWGTIVGQWDGKDVSGLVGEANDQGNDYAFMMNGFQQASALVPLVKYDKRYARAIAKWTLNLANASRLYYPGFLDSNKQDDFTWSNQFDPQSTIGYEALKQNWEGKALYGTGDAKRNGWAQTNLGLYGSSHVGYLAAIVESTDVEGILQLDLNKTDFFGDQHFPTFLYYNPYATNKQVTLHLGPQALDLYDAISENYLFENASGDFQVQIKAGEVILITYLPSGTVTSVINGKLYADGHAIDYHYGNNFTPTFRLKSFSTQTNLLEFNQPAIIYADIENAPSSVSYQWFINDIALSITTTGQLNWTTPNVVGDNEVKVEITSGGIILKDSLIISVVAFIPTPPVVTSIVSDKPFYIQGNQAQIIAHVENAAQEHFTYAWTVPSGTVFQQDSLLIWTTPLADGLYTIPCTVKNDSDLSTQSSILVLVKHETTGTTPPLAYYPMNIDVNDYSGNAYHAQVSGTQQANDALGLIDFAYRFSSGSDLIKVSNQSSLNFTDALTLSFWVSAGSTNHEAFILSHGSWEERWKVSITPDRKVRWTAKTENGVKDLDSSFPLNVNQYYHVTVVYSGYSMEMYLDGVLNTFNSHNGLILTTNQAITFGQKSESQTQYFLNGALDEVRIYNVILQPDEISLLKTLWHEETITSIEDMENELAIVFPNPSSNGVFWIDCPFEKINEIQLIDIHGKIHALQVSSDNTKTKCIVDDRATGLFFVRVSTDKKVTYSKLLFH